MSNFALFRKVVKAVTQGDAQEAKQLDAEIADDERATFNIYVTAVFFGAVGHRFEEDHSQAAIQQFANEMREEYRNAPAPMKPLVVEGLIRAAFGEEYFLDEISADDQLTFQFPIIRKIVAQSEHMQARIDDYLADAQTLANEWME